MDILSNGTFCPMGRFVPGTFCPLGSFVPGTLQYVLGRFVLGRFVLGRFVLGRFVCAPNIFVKRTWITPFLRLVTEHTLLDLKSPQAHLKIQLFFKVKVMTYRSKI